MEGEVKKYNFIPLTPTDKAENADAYNQALSEALENKELLNIAISGPYGSGKSSVIKTFEKSVNGRYKFINVSLASFNSNCKSVENVKPQNTNPTDEFNILNQKLELSILQQIFYHVKPEKIPASRFKRIVNKSIGFFVLTSSLSIIWLLASIVLFEPDFIKETTLWSNWIGDKTNVCLLATSFVFFVFGVGFLAWKTIEFVVNARLTKLNIKNGEIELDRKSDRSILNRYIDEIVYFFEKTDYSVVVFEDIDRFDNTTIFEKLREINIILNKNRQPDNKVRFVYALCDDFFTIKGDRTKFFDLIIPVVPIIDTSNSADKLIQLLSKDNTLKRISKKLVKTISLYIDDMRTMNNILNEYKLYENVIFSNPEIPKDINQIFSLVTVKNLYPTEFTNIYSDNKTFNYIFNDLKKSLRSILIERQKLKIQEYNSLYSKRKDEYAKSKETNTDDKISDLKTYINVAKSELEKHKKLLNSVEHCNLFKLLQYAQQFNINYDTRSIPPLLFELFKTGNITEDYFLYSSVFHPGNISKVEREFITTIKNNGLYDFNHELNNIEDLLEYFDDYEWTNEGLYNIKIFNYLLSKETKYIDIIKEIFNRISLESERAQSFVAYYWEIGLRKNEFVFYLTKHWPNFWNYVRKNLEKDSNEIFKIIIINAESDDIPNINADKSFYNYFNNNIAIVNEIHEEHNWQITHALSELKMKIQDITPLINREFVYDEIYLENYYEINIENLNNILRKSSNASDDDLLTKHFTSIINSGCSELIGYVQDNFNKYFKEVYSNLEHQQKEDQVILEDIFNNELLSDEVKNIVLRKVGYKIGDISSISDLWINQYLFENNLVHSNWYNVSKYFEKANEIDNSLISFINIPENYIPLSEVKMNEISGLSDAEISDFHKLFVMQNSFSDDAYVVLLDCFDVIYKNFSYKDLSDKKVSALIDKGVITLTQFNFDFLSKNYERQHVGLIEKYPKVYLSLHSSFILDPYGVNLVLSSDIFSNEEKYSILTFPEYVDYISEDNSNLCLTAIESIPELIAQNIHKPVIFEVFNCIDNVKDIEKLSFVLNYVNFDTIDKDLALEIFEALGVPYSDVTIGQIKVVFPKNSYKTNLEKEFIERVLIPKFVKKYKINKNGDFEFYTRQHYK